MSRPAADPAEPADPSGPTASGLLHRPGRAGAPPGLHLERTALAWRRTVLAVIVGALVGARVTEASLGVVAWVAGALAVCSAVAAGSLRTRRRGPVGTGVVLLATTATVLAGLLALGYVLALAAGQTSLERLPGTGGTLP